MRIFLDGFGKKVDLPVELSTKERIEYVENLIAENPDSFDMSLNGSARMGRFDKDTFVKIRLDILATYLITSVENYSDTVMTEYKKRFRPLQEMAFSQFENSVNYTNS